jgi:hypothetical protein
LRVLRDNKKAALDEAKLMAGTKKRTGGGKRARAAEGQNVQPKEAGEGESTIPMTKAKEDVDAVDSIRKSSNRAADEGSRYIRALTHSYIEGLRLTAGLMDTFTNEVVARNHPDKKKAKEAAEDGTETHTSRRLVAQLPSDIYSGYLAALDESVEIPRKVLDKFYEVYKEPVEP